MKHPIYKISIALCLLIAQPLIHAQNTTGFETWWEKSGYTETPRYEQTIEFCKKLDKASSLVSYHTFGKSPQGRDLPLLILDKNGYSTPEEVNRNGKLKILIQACVHAGESEGKDAGFALFRDIVIRNKNLNLDSITILFIPIFNVDGHERFTPYTRINQNGPKEAGWRTNANNLNLNRDFLKADAPEMQAWLKLFNEWNPDFFIDCHTTDGADYQYPVTIAFNGFCNKELNNWLSEKYSPRLTDMMAQSGYPIFNYYVWFRQWHNPLSGLVDQIPGPRFAGGYVAARNRFGLLVETHMLKDYKTRVLGTYYILQHTLEIAALEKSQMQSIITAADKFTSSEKFRSEPCLIESKPSMTDSVLIEFKGFEYTVEKSSLTGGNWYKYSNKPVDFLLPMYGRQIPTVQVQLPDAYIIPVEWTEIIGKLELHGISYRILSDSTTMPIETYRFSNQKWAPEPYEGHQLIESLTIDTIQVNRLFPAGSVVIPTNQPNVRLLAYMFEPQTPESFLRWGYFNSVFEEKEYVETYVMEAMAREMIKNDPGLKVRFDKLKSENPEFAADSYAQLIWFYKQTPFYDTAIGIYPVGRICIPDYLKKFTFAKE